MADANDWTNFMGNYKNDISAIFEKDGMNGVHRFLIQNLDQWKQVPLNIAVTGNSGVGKSSFINTLRGTFADDEDGAETDVVQCTKEPTPYAYPTNRSLIIWDLPGVGTPDFPRETYLERVQFHRYDCFIIILASRFTENDLWLANVIKSMNESLKEDDRKLFYFVRTKVDKDLSSFKKSHRHPEPEENTLKRLREEIQIELKKKNFQEIPLYLIENYEPYKYDFSLLTSRILESKALSFALSLSVLTENLIDAKVNIFNERMWKVCLASAYGGFVPIPGLSAAIDGALLVREATFYREQLGLNAKGLERAARVLNISINDLQKTLDLESVGYVLTLRGIILLCTGTAFTEYVERASKFAIPVVGSFIACGVSFYATQYILQKLLKSMVNDAVKIRKRFSEKLLEENP